ncbi:hypothetical protein Poli38472_013704 [Pythium oligandrum]|uniref:Lipase-like C-terminal domain-containing protein n=1 Tax=Pythium oligandrum TaxID=41045 RepID=A0A8K1CE78_PYTOL|nr:hypothetical protein Poli38472_013704 [Pythium oligandrum]|eukprot:TMW61241.1 hypothetical protein Poli38472_013704 [Pythium oligandrum]
MPNTSPIILVHGFFGKAESPDGTKYFGRHHGDLAQKLRLQGHQVYTVSIGPFASNWDRACELYAQIKGGRVDYGEKHSAHHNHKRFGREYAGFYPQWGDVVDGQVQKVHLIGHSMGGPTSRMMAQLLAHGTKGAPVEEDPESHQLFSGGKDWVLSITTIASPNQGTTLMDRFFDIADYMEDVLAFWFSMKGIWPSKDNTGMDPMLDQWDVSPRSITEGVHEYLHRVLSSHMFAPGFMDIAPWSLSTEGAKQENTWVTTLPNVFYYSISTECTEYNVAKDGTPLYATTRADKYCISSGLRPFAKIIASDFTTKTKHFPDTWRANDGVVNTESMDSDGHGPLIDFNGQSRAGHWMHFPHVNHVDHASIVGGQKEVDPTALFLTHATILASLPTKTKAKTVVDAPEHVVKRLLVAIASLTNREPPPVVAPVRPSRISSLWNIFNRRPKQSIV